MAEVCSCGTYMVEGALFCHRCGKPQRDYLPVVEESTPETVPERASETKAAVEQHTATVGFHNSVAVRIGFTVACLAAIVEILPVLYILSVLWPVAAGFVSVALYRRSTGQALTVRGGAKMGWVTGVLNSVIVMILFAISVAASPSDITQQLRERDPVNYAKALSLMQRPELLAVALVMLLLLVFLFYTTACVAGGALGASVLRKNEQRQ